MIMNPKAVQAWDESLPELEAPVLDIAEVAHAPCDGHDEDEWEALSVEISESPSMVAENPWGR